MSKFLSKLKKLHIVLITFILIIFLGFAGQYFYRFYSLLSKNYILQSSDIYRLDTFHMLGRAFEYSGGSRYSSPRIEFESQNRYSFTIDNTIYLAIVDKPELSDTLKYHDLKFVIYSDKEALEKYKREIKPLRINVLQIQIGEKKYIDIDKVNQIERHFLFRQAILQPVFVLFVIFFTLKYETWTDGEKSVWGAIFLLTMIGLYFLL